VKWTGRRRVLRSEKHTWKTWNQCALDNGALGRYVCAKCTEMIQKSSRLNRHGV
jgi:hypothetical protein